MERAALGAGRSVPRARCRAEGAAHRGHITRAATRHGAPPPILSAARRNVPSPPRHRPAAQSRSASSGKRKDNRQSCWRVRPRRGRHWSRRESAARGGRPAPGRRCPRAILAWSRSPNPRWPIRAGVRRADSAMAAAMLGAALSAYPARQVAVLAPSRTARSLGPSLAMAHARGMIVIEHACDPWSLLDHADRVYSVGGEIGFLALLAGVPVTAFASAEYTGWGVTDDHAAAAARLPAHGGRNFRRHLPHRDTLPRSVPRCRDRLRGGAGNSRRVAPDRDHEPPHRGMRRNVVLEAAAHCRFRAFIR